MIKFLGIIDNLDRRIIYLIVGLSLFIPIVTGLTLPPAQMGSAEQAFSLLDSLAPGQGVALVAADWGPNTLGENQPQTELAIEHLMRRRIPLAILTTYNQAGPFIETLPRKIAERLAAETGEQWDYGKDWINLGLLAGGALQIQNLAKSENIAKLLQTDAYGSALSSLPVGARLTNIRSVSVLIQLTGLTGTLSAWIQMLQAGGYSPPIVHGCTSITVPEAHNYLAAKQIAGLFEGVAGAAWYEKLMSDTFSNRKGNSARSNNTGVSCAQLLIIFFMLLGNIGMWLRQLYPGTAAERSM